MSQLSRCCGAEIKWGDVCSECLEHTEAQNEFEFDEELNYFEYEI